MFFFLWTTTNTSNVFASSSVKDMFPDQTPEEETEDTVVDDAEIVDEESIESPNLFVNFLKLFVALAFIIILIYFVLKLINGKNKMFQKAGALENLGGIPLGSNKSMQAVRVGDKVYVLGIGDNVELLLEVTEEKTKEELTAKTGASEFNAGNLLKTVLKKEKTVDNKDQSMDRFQDLFKRELSTLVEGRKKITDQLGRKEEKDNE